MCCSGDSLGFDWGRKRMALGARCKLFLLASLLYISTASSPVALAQDAIRVETNQVLVPVFVLDKEHLRRLERDPGNFLRAAMAGDTKLVDAISEGVVIRGLTTFDFQVFEDGEEQTIQNVAYERSIYWDVRDNWGHHTEYIGPGGGKWSSAEWPPGLVTDVDPPHYVIAYSLPKSPEGSCHQIKVKVNRRNVLVGARSEYCNTRHSASDPLNGTRLGKQMEIDLAVPKNNNVDISLLAFPLYTNSDAARVQVALDWPWESLKGKSRTRGVLGLVFKKDGTLLTRFSDLADREGVANRELPDWIGYRTDRPDAGMIENRYEMQLTLPPGEYDLRVVLSDGTRFGRAEVPLLVESYDRKALAVSGVSLCKRISDVSAYSSGKPPKLPGAWTAKIPGNYLPLVSKDIEFKPTADTRFKNGETLYTYFEVYEPSLGGQSPATVQIQIRIVDQKTGEVKSDSQPISAMPYLKEGSPVIPIGRGIDISKLSNGSYRLDVQASDSTGKSTAWRTANFTIE